MRQAIPTHSEKASQDAILAVQGSYTAPSVPCGGTNRREVYQARVGLQARPTRAHHKDVMWRGDPKRSNI